MNNKFELGETTIVSDPCYNKSVWCRGEVKTKPGTWFGEAVTEDGDGCVAELLCWHSSYSQAIAESADKQTEFEVGVDSGQAGVFNSSIYPDGESTGEYGELDTFYGKVCELTCGGEMCGVVEDKGFVSSSGYGDGGYNCYVKEVNGEVVAIRIVFISSEDDE